LVVLFDPPFLLADADIHIQADSDQSGMRFEAGLRGKGRNGRTNWTMWLGWASMARGLCVASRTSWAMRRRRASVWGWTSNWRWAGGASGFGWARGASGSGWARGAVIRMMVVIVMRRSWFNTTGWAMRVAIDAFKFSIVAGSFIVDHGRFVRYSRLYHK
jgi:hypothetical protein